MKTRLFPRLIAALVIACSAAPALADASRDPAASQKIDEAVNSHYLMMELDKAEGILKSVIQTCEDKCSPGMVAKAWMYIGIVRGSGRNDLSGASEAFATAQSIEPNVKLDRDLASPETQATFDSLTGAAPAAKAADAEPAPPPPVVASGNVPGDMRCALESGATIATRMPIPVSCSSDAEVVTAVLKFKEYGSKDWKKVELTKKGEAFEGTISCDATAKQGPLEWFVGGKNAAGEYVDQYGSKKEPATFNMSDSGETELVLSDGSTAVRCADASDCPPDFPGCSSSSAQCGELDWGAACKNSGECKCGLLCDGGTCNNAPSCTTSEECSTGLCENGYCAAKPSGPAGPFKRHHLSLAFAVDSVSYGGEDLCTLERQDELQTLCFDANGNPAADTTQEVFAGFQVSQYRILAGYDYAFSPRFQLGGRAGYIIGGNPTKFIPIHLEARATYQFFPLSHPGWRLNVYAGAGLGDMDFRYAPVGGETRFTGNPPPPPVSNGKEYTVYKLGGDIFAQGGLGAGYAFTENISAMFNISAVITFPVFNFGLQPALNVGYAF